VGGGLPPGAGHQGSQIAGITLGLGNVELRVGGLCRRAGGQVDHEVAQAVLVFLAQLPAVQAQDVAAQLQADVLPCRGSARVARGVAPRPGAASSTPSRTARANTPLSWNTTTARGV
jgi:hypothetical protein